jgi:glucose-1-phosphate cytidylyltransferase
MSNTMRDDLLNVPVLILCGGLGVNISETGARINKSLVPVNGEPMLFHVIRIYLRAGLRSFVIAGGFQYDALLAALEQTLGKKVEVGTPTQGDFDGQSCSFVVIDTGIATATGDRIKACRNAIGEAPFFAVTYSDTLANVDIRALISFHRFNKGLATLVAAKMPTRFRVLGVRWGDRYVRGFAPQPILSNDPINGGFYILNAEIFGDRYLGSQASDLVFEEKVVDTLVADGRLLAYFHSGSWQNLDTERDLKPLSRIAAEMHA